MIPQTGKSLLSVMVLAFFSFITKATIHFICVKCVKYLKALWTNSEYKTPLGLS